jgi:hypothetical protein
MEYALNDDDYTTTVADAYENVTEGNWHQFLQEAMGQYRAIMADDRISGFYLVDWRVNFFNLNDYIRANVLNDDCPAEAREFTEAFEESMDTLYRRLGIE